MKTRILLGAVLVVAIVVIAVAYFTLPKSTAPAPAQTTVPATQTAQSTSTTTTYTMADVAEHNSASSCWSAINGKVYNLTNWISEHPGGPEHIIPLCGTDGSAAFNAQHGSQGAPAQALAQMYIGDLAQ
jgi:cytochrome b involved in lipid metabolism